MKTTTKVFCPLVVAIMTAFSGLAACSSDEPQAMMLLVTPVVMQPVLVGQGIYTVQSGGTLAAVARRTGANLSDLMALNPGIPVNQRLAAGAQVWLPFPWAP